MGSTVAAVKSQRCDTASRIVSPKQSHALSSTAQAVELDDAH